MQFLPEHIYHLYNQGNNRDPLFFNRDNYLYFLKGVKKHLTKHAHLLAWCLMPNHYHFLIKVKPKYESIDSNNVDKKIGALNRSIGILQSSYTQAINKKMGRSGSLFRTRAKSKSLNDQRHLHNNYALNCFLYIHQNPMRAGLTKSLQDWEFSSYKDYAGLRNGELCNYELTKEILHLPDDQEQFESFSNQTIPEQFLKTF